MKLIAVLLLGLLFAGNAFAQALLPNGQQQFVDSNGAPLSGGSVYFYIPSTTTPKTTWVDQGLTTVNGNPVVLDSAGRATIWGAGSYRQIVQDSLGNTIWDQITSVADNGFGSVNNEAGLKALPAGAFTAVRRLGYISPGDGGEATYDWSGGASCVDDGGSCIAPNSGGGRWLLSKSPAISAAVWGIFPGTDITTKLQSAVTYVCTNGVKLQIPSSFTSAYQISSTINVGNGSSSLVSTQNGCELSGVGVGIAASEVLPAGAPARLQWIGASGGTMMVVQGPIYGIRLYGITFDGGGLASYGLILHHPIGSRFEELLVENWGIAGGYAYTIDAYPLFPGIAVGAQHDTFIGVRTENPIPGAFGSGIQVGSANYSAVADVAQITFMTCQFAFDGTAGSTGVGINLKYTDNISFYETSTNPVFAGSGTGIVVSPPAGNTTFPGAIAFYNSPIIGNVANPGAGWTATNGIGFFPYPTGDGETIPTGNTFGQFFGILETGKFFGLTSPIQIAGTSATGINMAGATDYSGIACFDTVATSCPQQLVYNGTITALRVSLSAVIGGGQNVVATLEKNGADTAITCTMTNASNICVVAGSVAVVNTDNLTLKTVGSGGAPTAIVSWSVKQIVQNDGTF